MQSEPHSKPCSTTGGPLHAFLHKAMHRSQASTNLSMERCTAFHCHKFVSRSTEIRLYSFASYYPYETVYSHRGDKLSIIY